MPSMGGSGTYGGDDPSGGASRDSGGYGLEGTTGSQAARTSHERQKAETQAQKEHQDYVDRLAFSRIQPDWTGWSSETRQVRQGQRQTDSADILQRGELSSENWGEAFETNYAQVAKRVRDFGFKNIPATDQLLYRGYQNIQRSQYLTGQIDSSTEGTAAQIASRADSNRRITESGSEFGTTGREQLSQWQAKYNVQVNVHENIAQSQKRMKYRERFASMQISKERSQGRRSRAALRRGSSGLAVSFGAGAGTGLGIPQ